MSAAVVLPLDVRRGFPVEVVFRDALAVAERVGCPVSVVVSGHPVTVHPGDTLEAFKLAIDRKTGRAAWELTPNGWVQRKAKRK